MKMVSTPNAVVPRDHYIPQSVLTGFVTPGKGVAWWRKDGTLVRHRSVADTASVRGGNTVDDPISAYYYRSEDEWTREFDSRIAPHVKKLRKAAWGSSEMATAAQAVVPLAASLPYRRPRFAYDRLSSALRLHEALTAVGDGTLDAYITALATCLGVDDSVVESLGLTLESLRPIALSSEQADLSALDDLARGPLAMAREASRQWQAVAPVRIYLQRAAGRARFQIGDHGAMAIHREHGRPQMSLDTWIWADEDLPEPPPETPQPVALSVTVSSRVRLHGVFDPGDSPGVTFEDILDEGVVEHNRRQFEFADAYVFGDPEGT